MPPFTSENRSVGQKVHDARIMRGLTQTELAADYVTPSMISQVEADRARPSNALLTVIAERLALPVDYFTNGSTGQMIQVGPELLIAEYWLLAGLPMRAHQILSELENLPTEAQRQYQLLIARTWRMLQQPQKAERAVSKLLDEAIRRQDKLMLFDAYKESGYLEYDMNRPQGARHEWSKALEIGESIAHLPEYASVRFHAELAEIYMRLHHVYQTLREDEQAMQALRRAIEFSRNAKTFQTLALFAIDQAQHAIEASEFPVAERGMRDVIAVVQWSQITAQHTRIESLAQAHSSTEMGAAHDATAWHAAAAAVSSANPEHFIASEVSRIQSLLDTGAYEQAQRRVERALGIAIDYCDETADFADALQVTRIQLHRLQAECQWAQGNRQHAVEELLGLAATTRDTSNTAEHLETLVCLVRHFVDFDDVGQAMACSAEIEEILQRPQIIH